MSSKPCARKDSTNSAHGPTNENVRDEESCATSMCTCQEERGKRERERVYRRRRRERRKNSNKDNSKDNKKRRSREAVGRERESKLHALHVYVNGRYKWGRSGTRILAGIIIPQRWVAHQRERHCRWRKACTTLSGPKSSDACTSSCAKPVLHQSRVRAAP